MFVVVGGSIRCFSCLAYTPNVSVHEYL